MNFNLISKKESKNQIKISKIIDSDESTPSAINSSCSPMNLSCNTCLKKMGYKKPKLANLDKNIRKVRHFTFSKEFTPILDYQNSHEKFWDASPVRIQNPKSFSSAAYPIYINSDNEPLSSNLVCKSNTTTKIEDFSNRKIYEKLSQIDKNGKNFTVYSEIFNLVIKKDKEFGLLLTKIKDVYDSIIINQENEKLKQKQVEENKEKNLSNEYQLIEETIKDLENDKINLQSKLESKELEIKNLLHQCTIIPTLLNENQHLKSRLSDLEKHTHFPSISTNESFHLSKSIHEKPSFTRKSSSKTQFPVLNKKSTYLKLPNLESQTKISI
ncbi:unnamed protein product [Blepharisma stoltei]|uniref:Translin-associated factor X-interacting protein 1 N-terminal domain-containing protein n=1 Tax=Blepharisma stoltei TaxID=1481888 RepID=A0AAU9KNQ1_9CILI|nr:unnamed protein product [Blepharisma stoltei]